jgi:hypothetical protein
VDLDPGLPALHAREDVLLIVAAAFCTIRRLVRTPNVRRMCSNSPCWIRLAVALRALTAAQASFFSAKSSQA